MTGLDRRRAETETLSAASVALSVNDKRHIRRCVAAGETAKTVRTR